MQFRRSKKVIIWPVSWSYYDVREFEILENDNSDRITIEKFIKSVYFIWQETRHKQPPNLKDSGQDILDMNFHGFYNPLLLDFKDYIKTDFTEFRQYFIDSINKEINNDPYIPDIINNLDTQKDPIANYYILAVKDQSKRHENTVYDFFYSGIIINQNNKTIRIVEFGLD